MALGNIPEGISGTAAFKEGPTGARRGLLAWSIVGLLLFVTVMAGYAVGSFVSKDTIALFNAFAGGAAIAGVSSELLPDAYERSGVWINVATVAGFLLSFWLFSLDYSPMEAAMGG